MEYRTMDITVISAENLKNVNLFTKMSVYMTVTASGNPSTLNRTRVDHDCGNSPRWGHRISLPVADHLKVVFRLFSDRVFGDKEIGEVSVSVKELLDGARNGGDGGERVVEYQVHTVSGKKRGTLKFSYKFGDKIAHAPPSVAAAPPHYAAAPYSGAQSGKPSSEPVMAYPAQHAPPPQQGYGYPPPQQGYGYPPPQQGYGYPPPQQGYGYPPPQQGYGYPPPQQGYGYGAVPPKKRRQGMGGGLGLGLGAGMLGGLLVGDMISDAGDYDGGYDGGFDDGGGFDF